MHKVLVTGGTGTLGRVVVPALRAGGHDVAALSRRRGPDLVTADLRTGHGLEESLEGVSTVLHLATTRGSRDTWITQSLIDAVRIAGASSPARIVYVSIVGIDRIPYPYYRTKLACERLLATSGLPHAVVRLTQFHDFLAGFFAVQRWSPMLLTPDVPVQPIDLRDAAAALVPVVSDVSAVGRMPDVAGPQVLTGRAVAKAYRAARRWSRPVVPARLPGKTFAAFKAGHLTAPAAAVDGVTFAQWAQEHAAHR